MIDITLLASAAVALVAFSVAVRILRPRVLDRRGLLDASLGAALVGVLAGRIVALALDDPRGLLAPRDVLLIRGGVEFWPGVVAAAGTFLFLTRGNTASPVARLTDIGPAAIAGYGGYEALCLARGGCFGPAAAVGLRPPGLSTSMMPVGLVVAVAVLLLAALVHRVAGARPVLALTAAIGGVAAFRSAAAFGLPHVGTDLSRPHLTSLAVAGMAAVAALIAWRTPTASSSRATISTTTAPAAVQRAEEPK